MSAGIIKAKFPNNNQTPSFFKDSTNMAAFIHDKSKNNNCQKMKISEKLNLIRSYNKINAGTSGKDQEVNQTPQKTPISAHLLQTGQCLNIFEDDDEEFMAVTNTHSGSASCTNKLDQSMDLRGSFEELECTVQIDNDKNSNNSRSTKHHNSLQVQNSLLRQENYQLKKKLQNMDKLTRQVAALKKKYMSSIDQINRLENQRRTIITDKVKFQSKYHKELQDKDLLLRELENLRR